MSYRINHYNGTLVAVVNDGTVDNTLDITLVGKNYAGYGTIQNDNFVYLLENFANINPPNKPVGGQIWFDSGNKKLKFYDGSRFRTTGGAEVGTTEPVGLTVGDFWWDTVNNQLHAYTGSGFALIGPQVVASAGATEMVSTTVTDVDRVSHPIIKAISNGVTVFTISSDAEYTLDDTLNPIPGFETIRTGITLAYTNNDTYLGVTQSDHRFWGTATNADRLGGKSADSFVQAGDAAFNTVVNFADVGFTVGNPIPKLKIFNSNDLYPTVANIWNEQINFTTTVGSVTKRPMQLNGNDILPGTAGISNIGANGTAFNQIYANTLNGTATQANSILVGSSTYATASYLPNAGTAVIRTATDEVISGRTITAGAVKGSFFVGIATSARYADLAEKYLADAEYDVGTVVCIGGDAEITAASFGTNAIGVVSDKPAYLMNEDLEGGTIVALKGRVPVKVKGPVRKGDMLIASGSGYGTADNEVAGPRQFAVALASNDEPDVKLVECLIL